MANPRLQVDAVRDSSESNAEGKIWLRKSATFLVDATAAGTANLITLPADTLILFAAAWVKDGLNGSGTLEVGISGNADMLIDSADYTETSDNAYAVNRGSSNADEPNAYLLTSSTTIIVTVGGNPTSAGEGSVLIYLEWLELGDMDAAGQYLRSVTPSS